MRLVDAMVRGGHLSERALIDVCMTGDRPVHLDRCDMCAERAVELGRWLDEVRTIGLEEADAAFPAERLAAQQSQILRRLEQLDRPARVIAFPGQSRYDRLESGGRGIRPAWVGVAAAAGLILGLLGGQISGHFRGPRVATPPARPPVQTQQPSAPGSTPAPAMVYDVTPSLDLDVYDRPQIDAYAALDAFTPHAIVPEQVVRTTNVRR